MNEFKINVDIEPTDKYLKAKLDLLQAIKSFESLTQQQKLQLVQEAFGVAKATAIIDLLNRSKQ